MEEAQEKYDDTVTNASFNLQTLQLKIPSLQQAVTEAKENQEIQQAQAKLTYETALSMAERAESYRGAGTSEIHRRQRGSSPGIA